MDDAVGAIPHETSESTEPAALAGVAAIAGRRIDAAQSKEARFPGRDEATVREGVKRLLKKHEIGTVVASAACGADIVALEVALELGIAVKVVLPFDAKRFRETSVADRGGDWGERFDALLNRAELKGNVTVVESNAADDEAAYALVTRQILADARALAAQYQAKALALAIWDERPRDTGDATQDFIELAERAAMSILQLSTLPVERAEKYVSGGEEEPEPLLDFWPDLARAEPVLANALARELATRFLHAKKRMKTQAVDRLWKACKSVEAFGFARRILGRRQSGWSQISVETYVKEPSGAELRQQHALCTSKDADLSAAMRHDWALRILKEQEAATDPETQGIAGGIWKRRWEWDGARSSLEKSLKHYRAGSPHDLNKKHAGYCTINCAFLLDLLASQIQDPAVAEQYRAQAKVLREQLVAALKDETRDLWIDASLAEAYLGLGQFTAAAEAMRSYMGHGPALWEVETTLRQLVRLAHLLGQDDDKVSLVLEVPLGPDGEVKRKAALKSLLIGRVGLALSGGGFRASLYHLGVLARLAESDLLRHVEVLSCVSGGSIVGAYYYLCLRSKLQEKGERLTRRDYVDLVEDAIGKFREGVAQNVRTRVLATVANARAVTSGDNRAYAEAVSKTLYDTFYQSVLESDSKPLHELLIQPEDAPHDFHPGRHNWQRRNKVPVLVLNAATLNTGHSWQFTARSMGESPFSILPDVDSNARLRRPNYRDDIPNRSVSLRDAVAASACVPGLFAPLQLDRLYPKHDVRLVDGGVYDNQGAASLIEQDCQVVLISDAAGQLFTEMAVDGGHIAPLLRSVGIFQERIRQIGYDALFKRKQAGQLRGLTYTHLTQGLRAPAIDWDKCEDPQQPNDQLPDDIGNQAGNGAGVDGEIQAYLARMRTDLDVFNEIECAALMASGYQSIDAQLNQLFADVPALQETRNVKPDWFFSPLLPIISGQDANGPAFRVLRKHLKVSSLKIGRTLKLNSKLRIAFTAVAVVFAILLLILLWYSQDYALLTVGKAVIIAIPLLLGALLGANIGKVSRVLLDPRSALKVPLQHWGVALLFSAFANIVLKYIDPDYLKRGRLEMVLNAKASAAVDE